jgi:hypothetical protein
MTYVSRIFASQHDANTVYASFDGHQNEDFKPHILKSTDAGKSWTSIAGDLPENGPVMAIAEDPVNPNLIFVGTEFGLYFTTNGGGKWTRLRNGLPTIAVRDLAIQKQMGDLVVGTFGRSIYVLDDYTPLRTAEQAGAKAAEIFAVRDAWLYIPSTPFGGNGKADQGDSFFTGENPPMGALITYEVKQAPQTKRAKRLAEEREAERNGGKITYPTLEELRAEEEEQAPQFIFTITDAAGHAVRRLTAPTATGMRRVEWDLHSAPASIPLGTAQGGRGGGGGFFGGGPAVGPLVMPGKYKVSMALEADGKTSELAGAVEFNVVADGIRAISADDHAALMAFAQKVAKLQAAVSAAVDVANSTQTGLADIKRALAAMPSADPSLLKTADELERRDAEIILALSGDRIARQFQEETPPSILQRIGKVSGGLADATSKPISTQINDYKVAGELFAPVQTKLHELVEVDLAKFEKQLDAAGVPHTPGRVPNWKDQ